MNAPYWIAYQNLCKALGRPDHGAASEADMINLLNHAAERLTLISGWSKREDIVPLASFPALAEIAEAEVTYRERRGTYGPSEQRFADLALALFPEGLTLTTRSDWVRYGLFHMMLSKLARYTKDFHTPHVDSMHDTIVYAAMLTTEDKKL